jgi:hypothetical protein
MLNGLLLLLGVGLCLGLWNWSMAGRDRVLRAVVALSREMDLQALDDSVVLRSLHCRRGPNGHLQLLRVYRFEYSLDGRSRLHGDIALAGLIPLWARLQGPEGDLHIDLRPPLPGP